MNKYLQFVFLLFFIPILYYSQQGLGNYVDYNEVILQQPNASQALEVVLQNQSIDSLRIIISAVPDGSQYCTDGVCDFEYPTNYFDNPIIYLIPNDISLTNGLYYFDECNDELPQNGKVAGIRYGKYKFEFQKYFSTWATIYTIFYDNRDCGFVSNCSDCEQTGNNDITIRYNGNNLYLFNGHNSTYVDDFSESGDWALINNNSIINWWEIKGGTDSLHCAKNIEGAPTPPQFLRLVHLENNHPKLIWEFNTELDLKNYKIYRSIDNNRFRHIATVSDNYNFYIDSNIILSGNNRDPIVSYKITAVDLDLSESDYSNVVIAHQNGFMENNLSILSDGEINLNNIHFRFQNDGVLGLSNQGSTTFEEKHILYSSGFLLSGKVDDTLFANGIFYSGFLQDYLPGKFGDESQASAKIFTVKKDDPPFGESWQNWSEAVEYGAKFYDGNGDGVYNPVDLNNNGLWDVNEDKPDILGEITHWFVINDGVSSENRLFENSSPLGIEIKHTIFAVSNDGNPELSNVIFVRYEITNTGQITEVMDSVYFGIFSDPDIGEYYNDLVGTDTLLQSVFAYNSGEDPEYGDNTPSLFISVLQGPSAFIPNETFTDINSNGIYDEGVDIPLDSAIVRCGALIGEYYIPGAKNLSLVSSAPINRTNDFRPPSTKDEARYYLLGGYNSQGNEINPCDFPLGNGSSLDNCDKINTKFIFSGDPVEGTGWLNIVPQDEYLLGSFGPFRFPANKTKEIIFAFVVGQNNSALQSISDARTIVNYMRDLYENNFSDLITGGVTENEIVKNFELMQNYPNPFNPITTIEYSIPNVGAENFSPQQNVQLKIYDVLGCEVATLVNKKQSPGNYSVKFDATNLPSGVYFYILRAGKLVSTKKMILLK